MSACPAWCQATHKDSDLHQRCWLTAGPVTGGPVSVSLVYDGKPGSAAGEPRILICAAYRTVINGIWPPMLAPRDAAYLAEIFRLLGHADVADAISEAVGIAKEAER